MNKNTKAPPPRIELLDDEELYNMSPYVGATFGESALSREPLRLDRDITRRAGRDRK